MLHPLAPGGDPTVLVRRRVLRRAFVARALHGHRVIGHGGIVGCAIRSSGTFAPGMAGPHGGPRSPRNLPGA